MKGDLKGGIFNIKVYNGGNAICGPGASASISSKLAVLLKMFVYFSDMLLINTYWSNLSGKYHKSSCAVRHHDKAIGYPFEDHNKTEMLQGPGIECIDITY